MHDKNNDIESRLMTELDSHPTGPLRSRFEEIPRRRLGRTGVDVTILGLGGEGILRSRGREKSAEAVINTALDLGINYLETAPAYEESESYYGSVLAARSDMRDKLFVASKSHARDKAGAARHLEESLSRLRTDYLDLWQVHDVRTEADIEQIFGPGGAIEAFVEAREKGLVRFLGVTGHEDPQIIKRCLELFDFDTVLVPVNPAETHYKCFLEEIVPIASTRDLGIIGMKTYMKGMFNAPKKVLFCYALTQPITVATIGVDNVMQLKENVDIARDFTTMRYSEVKRVTEFIAPYARDLMFYKP